MAEDRRDPLDTPRVGQELRAVFLARRERCEGTIATEAPVTPRPPPRCAELPRLPSLSPEKGRQTFSARRATPRIFSLCDDEDKAAEDAYWPDSLGGSHCLDEPSDDEQEMYPSEISDTDLPTATWATPPPCLMSSEGMLAMRDPEGDFPDAVGLAQAISQYTAGARHEISQDFANARSHDTRLPPIRPSPVPPVEPGSTPRSLSLETKRHYVPSPNAPGGPSGNIQARYAPSHELFAESETASADQSFIPSAQDLLREGTLDLESKDRPATTGDFRACHIPNPALNATQLQWILAVYDLVPDMECISWHKLQRQLAHIPPEHLAMILMHLIEENLIYSESDDFHFSAIKPKKISRFLPAFGKFEAFYNVPIPMLINILDELPVENTGYAFVLEFPVFQDENPPLLDFVHYLRRRCLRSSAS